MIWAQHIPAAMRQARRGEPADDGVVPFPSYEPSQPLTPRQRAIWAISIVVVVLLVLSFVGYVGERYFRLSALDDYRTGYKLGAVWYVDGERVDKCHVAMEQRYGGSSWPYREPGWGEFRVGCEDAMRGDSPAAWYQLRDRLWGTNGVD